jgi:hypothetical protein
VKEKITKITGKTSEDLNTCEFEHVGVRLFSDNEESAPAKLALLMYPWVWTTPAELDLRESKNADAMTKR